MVVRAYWHVCDNFGDKLTPYLITKISGEDVESVNYNSKPSPFMVTGSLLNYNIHRAVVWGSGCAFEYDLDPNRLAGPSWEFSIIATRGLLSKQLVEKSGHKPIAFGDPGILLPHFYQPDVSKRYNIGIMCSWVDYDYVSSIFTDERISVINTMNESIEDVIDKMSECETILSSSLHGLVAAVAYGIPTAWVRFSDKMIGDGFKYHDFSSCLDVPFDIINLEGTSFNVEELVSFSSMHKLTINADDLLNCCPFKKTLEK